MYNWKKILNCEKLPMEEEKKLCNELMTMDVKMEALLTGCFAPADYYHVWERRIGTGLIGGKACGLLAARKLIECRLPEYGKMVEPHNSFFVGTDVFSQYLKDNECMELWESSRKEKDAFKGVAELKKRIREGTFSEEIYAKMRKVVLHYGQTPIIVRSSSLLEDGFGNAFSGKYESIFCMNQGNEEERLAQLTEAVKGVYESMLNPSAIEYRHRRGLLGADEKMALLIQRVEGQRYENIYMPVAAGMGCSYNPYKWMEDMNPDAGMLRMVMGLGTRAVERTPGDYPRLVSLDHAQANLRTTVAERHKFSQRQVDVLDLLENKLCTKRLEEVIPDLPKWEKRLALSHDTEAEELLNQRGRYQSIYFADCQGLVNRNEFIDIMQKTLKMLENEYQCPVDVEFAVNCTEEGELKISLLQCRPLQTAVSESVKIPEGVDEEFLFDVRRTSMRRSKEERLDLVVLVDPQNYYDCPYAQKPDVAGVIGRINQYFEERGGKKMMLLVPGRIGTSSPELGVPVVYADISRFSAICEVAYSEAGYRPELSYGSHMFQDLVEADVYYGAINDNSKTRLYQPELLDRCERVPLDMWTMDEKMSEIIKVYDVSGNDARLILNSKEGRAVCRIKHQ